MKKKEYVYKIKEIKKTYVNFIDFWVNTFVSIDKKTIKDNLGLE